MSLPILLRKPAGLLLRPLTSCGSVIWTHPDIPERTSLPSQCRHSTFCNSLTGRKRRVAATPVPAMFMSVSPLIKADSAQSSPAPVLTSSSATDQPVSPDTRQDQTVYRERYIPITRNSIIRYLSEEKDFLSEEERKLLPDLVLSLDSLLVKKYHGILEELKVLFDPINPDKDTLKSREWTRKQKLDHEFWLLQKLEAVMAKANFHQLPRQKVEQFLRDHETLEKVRVSVDPSRYDVLRFWVLGHDIPNLKPSISDRISRKFPWRSSDHKPREYFKRVVVALRLKQDSKLMLKAFKEVPVEGLEMLLPDGNIRMRAIDRTLVAGSVAVAGFGVLTKVVTTLVSLQVDWALVATLVTGAMGFRFWTTYRNRRNAYLLDVTRMLYFKNIANNQGLLTLLVDRAEDESLKEAMLTYVQLLKLTKDKKGFLVRSQPRPSEHELKAAVEQWLEDKTGVKIEFQAKEAVDLLQTLGLVTVQDGRFRVVPLEVAARLLPQEVPSVIAGRAADADITQGYSKDEFLETDDTYKSQDVQIRRYGWF